MQAQVVEPPQGHGQIVVGNLLEADEADVLALGQGAERRQPARHGEGQGRGVDGREP